MAKKFDVTATKATYFTTFYLLLTALTPLLLTPFVNIYGRRPAYIVRDPTLQAIYPPLAYRIMLVFHPRRRHE